MLVWKQSNDGLCSNVHANRRLRLTPSVEAALLYFSTLCKYYASPEGEIYIFDWKYAALKD